MIDSYWQWMVALALTLALILIPVIGWRLYLRTVPTPEPDVATEAASEARCTPMKHYPDLHDQVDMILDAVEMEEYERLYGRLRTRYAAMRQEEREQA